MHGCKKFKIFKIILCHSSVTVFLSPFTDGVGNHNLYTKWYIFTPVNIPHSVAVRAVLSNYTAWFHLARARFYRTYSDFNSAAILIPVYIETKLYVIVLKMHLFHMHMYTSLTVSGFKNMVMYFIEYLRNCLKKL